MNSQVRLVDGFLRLMAQTTRTADSRKDVPFGGFVDIVPHFFWGGVPPNPNSWGVNRRFHHKQAKYWKFHVIETTASILTKSGITIETTKWISWVVPIGAQQIQDGTRPPFWRKTVKSPYLCDCSTDFDENWQVDAHWPLAADQPLNFWISENWRWRRSPSWKIKKIAISPNLQWFDQSNNLHEIWYTGANGPHNLSDRLKIWIS